METFTYNYSATQSKEIERIRSKYLPKEENKLETLRRLDSRVQKAGMTESLSVGIVGSLVFGIGMCFGLGALPAAPWLAYLFGLTGISIMLPAYPIYKRISRRTKEALAPEILRLTDELIGG